MNQRLAALHTRAGRFTEGAVGCRTLESIYHDAEYPDEATRYGALAAQYEERAAVGIPVELRLSCGDHSTDRNGVLSTVIEAVSDSLILFLHSPQPRTSGPGGERGTG